MFNTIKAKFHSSLNKIRANKIVKKLAVPVMAVLTVVATAINSFAADTTDISGDTVETMKSSVSGLFTQITSVFSFVNLLQFVAIGIVASATIVLGYIGLRKLVSMITSAIKKGRMKTV